MKRISLASVVLFVTSVAFGVSVFAKAPVLTSEQKGAYVRDSSSRPVVSGSGSCIRTRRWTEQGRTPVCDPSYFQKKKKPVKAKPEPKPAVRKTEPPKEEHVIDHKLTISASAFFDTSSAHLRPSSDAVLDLLASFLKKVKLEVVVVTGYADSRGAKSFNDRLSADRANSVKEALVAKGIDRSHLYAEGKGTANPVGDNMTVLGRAQNRRVEVEVIGTTAMDVTNVSSKSFVDDAHTADSAHSAGMAKVVKKHHHMKGVQSSEKSPKSSIKKSTLSM